MQKLKPGVAYDPYRSGTARVAEPDHGRSPLCPRQGPSGLELYREVTGDEEDSPLANGPEVVHLREDEHFHSGPPQVKHSEIFVNGRKKVVTTRDLSFDEVVAMAFNPVPTGPNVMFTITYRHGPRGEPGGAPVGGWHGHGEERGWSSMSRGLISRSPDLKRLRDEGYDVKLGPAISSSGIFLT